MDGPGGLQARRRAHDASPPARRCDAAGVTLERHRPLRLPPGQRAHPRAPSASGSGSTPSASSTASPTLRQHVAPPRSRSRSTPRATTVGCSRRHARAAVRLRRRLHLGRRGPRVASAHEPGRLRARHRRLARHRRRDRAARWPPTAGPSRSTTARDADGGRGGRGRSTTPAAARRRAGRRRRPRQRRRAVRRRRGGARRPGARARQQRRRDAPTTSRRSCRDDDWDRVVDTNLSGAFRLTRRALRPMMRARYGRIVNVASRRRPAGQPRPGQLRRRQGRPRRHDQDGRRRGRPPRRDRQRRRPRLHRHGHDRRPRATSLLDARPRAPRRDARRRSPPASASSPPRTPPT